MALRILVLDDEPIVCKRLKPAFQKSGYEVETFTDSAAALQRMAEAAFDVIITDIKMEGADGFQVLERARELLPPGAGLWSLPDLQRWKPRRNRSAREPLILWPNHSS